MELVRDTDVMPCEPAENLPPALLGRASIVLNGRQVINGQPVRSAAPRLPPPLPTPSAVMAAAAAAAAATTPLAAAAGAGADGPQGGATQDAAQQQQQQPGQQQQQAARAADTKTFAEVHLSACWRCLV